MKRIYRNLLFFQVMFISGASLADTIPIKVTWPTKINVAQGFVLEVARDVQFTDIAFTRPVTDQHFQWDAQAQGVYHWRLVRKGGEGEERNTFISGSFVAVQPAANEGDPARISWAPVDGADRYKLYVFEGGARQRLMVTADTKFLVPRLDVPLMIEVVPFVGGRRLSREFRLNETLALEGSLPEPVEAPVRPAVAEGEESPDPRLEFAGPLPEELMPPAGEAETDEAPAEGEGEVEVAETPAEGEGEDQPVAESETAVAESETAVAESETAEHEATEEPERVPPRRHTYRLNAYVLGVEESLRAQKLEIDLDSSEQETGFGASLWVNAPAGIVVSGRAEYFDHTAKINASGQNGVSARYDIHQSRYLADLSIGYDVLKPFGAERHLLALFASGAMTQMPLLPVEYSGAPGTLPGLSAETFVMYGGGATYGFFAPRIAAFLEAGFLTDVDDKIDVSYQRLLVEYYPMAGLSLQLGGYARLSAVLDCADDAGVCLREGEVRTISKELGLLLGVGFAL